MFYCVLLVFHSCLAEGNYGFVAELQCQCSMFAMLNFVGKRLEGLTVLPEFPTDVSLGCYGSFTDSTEAIQR